MMRCWLNCVPFLQRCLLGLAALCGLAGAAEPLTQGALTPEIVRF